MGQDQSGPKHMAGQKQSGPKKTTTRARILWPNKMTDGGGGNYFPSPLPACRMLFILHAGDKKNARNANNEGEEE
jgi:hypothetical protein